MALNQPNPNGQSTSANSSPVVLASDQPQIPIQGNVAAATADSGNPVKVGAKFNTTLPTYTNGQRGDLQISAGGLLLSIARLNDTFGNGLSQITPGEAIGAASTTSLGVTSFLQGYNGSTSDRIRTATGAIAAGTGTLGIATVPSATALGLTSFQNTAVAATAVTVKASAGRLHRITIQNPNTSIAWLQVFNATAPTVGTTTPVMSIPIPASGIFEDFYPMSDTFGTAITIAATTTPTGSTANTTALFVSLGYI